MRSRPAQPDARIGRRPLRRRRRWPLRSPARRVYRLAAIPGVAAVATLTSGSWWNPLDWGDFVDGIVEGMGEALVWLVLQAGTKAIDALFVEVGSDVHWTMDPLFPVASARGDGTSNGRSTSPRGGSNRNP